MEGFLFFRHIFSRIICQIGLIYPASVDYSKNRNMILTSVIFVTGLSGVTLSLGDVSLSGMTLAAIVAMIMSLVFHALDRAKLTNDV